MGVTHIIYQELKVLKCLFVWKEHGGFSGSFAGEIPFSLSSFHFWWAGWCVVVIFAFIISNVVAVSKQFFYFLAKFSYNVN